jgi:hypothetical protein
MYEGEMNYNGRHGWGTFTTWSATKQRLVYQGVYFLCFSFFFFVLFFVDEV